MWPESCGGVVGVADGELDGVPVGVAVGVALISMVFVGDDVGVEVGVTVGVAVLIGELVGVLVGVALGVAVAVPVAVAVAVAVTVGVLLGVAVGASGAPSQPSAHVSLVTNTVDGQPLLKQKFEHWIDVARPSTQNAAALQSRHKQHMARASLASETATISDAATIQAARWTIRRFMLR